MKKNYFFIAALAIGMMSSCSNNEILEEVELPSLPDQVIDEGTTRMPIEMGISMPEASVSTRGTGTVGDLANSTNNQWNSQELGILMFKKGTSQEAKEILDDAGNLLDPETAPAVLSGVTFLAPAAVADPTSENNNGGLIRMINEDGNIQAKYYPMTGAYDFYGYHIDDIELAQGALVATGKTADNSLSIKLTGLEINGSQDILAAQTKEVNQTNYTSGNWTLDNATTLFPQRSFSSWAARNNIQPILDFQHVLTRLTFTIEAGSPEAAENYYVPETPAVGNVGDDGYVAGTPAQWVANTITINEDGTANAQGTATSTAVEIYKIEVLDVQKTMDLDITELKVDATDYTGDTYLDDFELMSIDEESTETPKALGELNPEAPIAYAANSANYVEEAADENTPLYPQTTRIGESMMIYPGVTAVNMNIYLRQWVVDTEDPMTGEPLTYKQKMTALPATATLANDAAYAAGTSYNINIKVYGFQRIEVYAALTGWTDGGDVNVDPEDQGWAE